MQNKIDIARSVWAVPPLALTDDYEIADDPNRALIRHIEAGGVTTFLYGGNANVYGFPQAVFDRLCEALPEWVGEDSWAIPSVGPDFGKLVDQAKTLAKHHFPAALALPFSGPRTQDGTERALRVFVQRAGIPVIPYIKEDGYLSPQSLGRLYRDGELAAIKYAVPRADTRADGYLTAILAEVPRDRVVSGFGEPPALDHCEAFGLAGFTAGAVCIAPRRSMAILHALQAGDFASAKALLAPIMPLEDLRQHINPIRVLHDAITLSGIAQMGPIMPMCSNIDKGDHAAVASAAASLMAAESEFSSQPAAE